MSKPLDKVYDPKKVEDKIYRLWEKSGYFNPDNLGKSQRANRKAPNDKRLAISAKPFTIIMPPPNANGALHFGHALFVTLEDLMIRYKRMAGYKALWLPGLDHAGFETQVVFDKKLEKEGRNRFDIPREELYKEIMDFTLTNKKIVENQFRKLGASCDWSREKFTLDKDIVEIVYDTFKKLYDNGLAYRGLRVINWCPKHQTALSDLEVKYAEREDSLYYIKYGPITLATVRPETKFGDTALAVNPKDKRYQKYIGKEIEAQGVLRKLKFKVVADDAVDPKFGTGVVKVTPAHDPADFEIYERHKNEIPGPKSVIDERGRLTGETGEFRGMKVAEAREKVAQKMKEIGILEKIEPYKHSVATCYKCGTTLEPLLKPQWFIKMSEKPKNGGTSLRDAAVEAVKSGKIKFVPKRFEKVFFHWMKNLRDWNISRQIVWGIRIPAWYCINCSDDYSIAIYLKNRIKIKELKNVVFISTKQLRKDFVEEYPDDWRDKIEKYNISGPTNNGVVVSSSKPSSCPDCKKDFFVEDNDVFDTWFSSGQWPFATLLASRGSKSKIKNQKSKIDWNAKDYKTFYPTDVMETGWDILFFWVARMIMLGLYRTGKIPFHTVYLHGLVRDKDRVKMSKSKGNVVDPLGIAETYGTDAVRMALIMGTTPGNDPIVSEDKIRGYRNFATKVWNISRFILMNYDAKFEKIKPKFSAADKKNLKQLRAVHKKITKDMESYKFHAAAHDLYHYIWHTFADKIIEASKPRLYSKNMTERATALKVILEILTVSLKLLHPFMPFVTEEIYQKLLIKNKKMLMIEKWQ